MANDVVLPATGVNVETLEQGGSGTTSATTASGNNILHFSSTPAFMANGMLIGDTTAPTVIPANTTVLSFTGTSVTMSANATGGGVGSGDTITFSAQRQVVAIGNKNSNGSAADVNSTPVAWSTEAKAQIGDELETAPTNDTASSGLNGRLQRVAQNITTLIAAVLKIGGDIAHGSSDSTSKPLKVGGVAIAHGTNPTAVSAAQRTNGYYNVAGVPFVIGGHPNIITKDHVVLASDGAQTDFALTTVSSSFRIVVTQISVVCSPANSVNVGVKIGFGTANVPTPSKAGTTGLLIDAVYAGGAGQQKGSGAAMVGVGALDEDLRLTCDSPTAGDIRIQYSYYTIEA